jgi:hypothetical protein
MGYGEVVGNESVHWTVAHEDERGETVALSSRQGRGVHPKVGHDVHVEKAARGCDPISLSNVGRRKGHGGSYRVRLRFARQADADAAAANVRVQAEGGMYVLVVDVPVIHRADPDEGPPAEIRVDW